MLKCSSTKMEEENEKRYLFLKGGSLTFFLNPAAPQLLCFSAVCVRLKVRMWRFLG